MTTTKTLTIAEPLTPLQQHVMDYLRIFLRENDCLPTTKVISEAFCWKSSNAAHDHLRALERKGHLARNELGRLMLARYSVGMWTHV